MTPFAREPGVRYIVRGGDVLYSVAACLLRLWPRSRAASRARRPARRGGRRRG